MAQQAMRSRRAVNSANQRDGQGIRLFIVVRIVNRRLWRRMYHDPRDVLRQHARPQVACNGHGERSMQRHRRRRPDDVACQRYKFRGNRPPQGENHQRQKYQIHKCTEVDDRSQRCEKTSDPNPRHSVMLMPGHCPVKNGGGGGHQQRGGRRVRVEDRGITDQSRGEYADKRQPHAPGSVKFQEAPQTIYDRCRSAHRQSNPQQREEIRRQRLIRGKSQPQPVHQPVWSGQYGCEHRRLSAAHLSRSAMRGIGPFG